MSKFTSECGTRRCWLTKCRLVRLRFGRRSLLAALLAVAAGVYLLPSPIDPKPHVLQGPPPALEGPLAVNTRLQKGRRLFAGQLHGPESFTADEEGNVYTGTVDGKLWRIGPDDSLTLVTHMGQNSPECGSSTDFEPVCGRPHGVRLDRHGQLIVADSYFGLHSVNPKTGEKTLLLANSQGADGVPFAFLNGLEISSQTGTIYFTDSSSRWGRRHVKLEVIELNSLGRLLSYDPETGSVKVLLDSLYMPNGIVLSPDEHFLLLAETSIGRILRYWLKGPKAGTKEIIMDNMIGYPDNIRLSDHGTFLVGITTPRFRKLVPPFLDAIAPYPAVKRFLAKRLSLPHRRHPGFVPTLLVPAEGRRGPTRCFLLLRTPPGSLFSSCCCSSSPPGHTALEELHSIIQEVKYRTALQSAKLIRQLRRRDRLYHKQQKNYDIITACLQAVSQKRRVDTRLKFTIEPSLGKNGFQQWYDALKAVARLPTGIPKEWRKRVWLTLADQYLHSISIDWEKTLRFAFNERSNPDDDSLGIQIVKDLHRTGCSSYCGQEGEQDRVVLKRVLLAYARWNKSVGYCQGFNVLAALILEVTEGNESDALKVMIYLIDKVLPESYFANNLRALSVDMAVFRDLLRLKLPRLSQHLHHLQKAANREAGGSYEPPLTNVFTMQWFLTMFATCLPASTVLKIWDSVFFEGSEVLFRVALAIWERLGERIEYCQTADEFYSTMGCLTQEMLEDNLIDSTELMQEVYSMAVFPFPQLAELREKYTYNITPFPTSVKSNGSGGLGNWESDDDADMDDEDSVVTALGCLGPLGGLLAPELQRYQKHLKDHRAEQGNIAELSPGAVGAGGAGGGGGRGGAKAEHQAAINSMMMERMNTDIYALKKQYARIKRRQQQQAMQLYIRTDKCPATRVLASQLNPSGSVINHLLLGRKPRGGSRLTSTSTSTLPGSRATFLSQSQNSPTRQRCDSNSTGSPGSTGRGAGSPWRAHVRAHRRNIARARAQLGFGDSEEREDEEEEGALAGLEGKEEREVEENDNEKEKEGVDSSVSPSTDPSGTESVCEENQQVADESKEVEVAEVVVQLHSLDLEKESNVTSPNNANSDAQLTLPEPKPVPQVPLLPPPPSSNRHKESHFSGSERNSASDRHLPTIALPPPDRSFSIPSSSPSTASPTSSPVPTSASLGPSCSSSPSPPSTPTPSSTSFLWPSPSANDPSSLSLPASSTFYKTSSPSTPSLSSISSLSRSHMSSSPSTPVFSSTGAITPKQQVFSPFPSVKQPRKSAAARNLGLYGPTSRTPTVHFPHLTRNLNRSSGVGTTGRR